MSASLTCPQCGTTLPDGTPAWLCPQCLLRQAAGPNHIPTESNGTPPSGEATSEAATVGRQADDILPRRLGDYELLERIGQGGMGVVYRARQASLDRQVAVKVLPPSAVVQTEVISRFRTEAVTAASRQHPNIVAVHEVGRAEGQHYLVMDCVSGPTLADLTSTGPPGGGVSPCNRRGRPLRA
jgi:serine/threonine protein kinase